MEKRAAFISHAHADNVLCDSYASALSALGIDVWYDRTNMEYAQLIAEEIGRELRDRTAFVVFLTPNAVASRWVKLEIGTFLHYWTKEPDKRIIVPVVLADCEVPPLLESFNRIDVSLMSSEEVTDSLARLLGVEPPRRMPATMQLKEIDPWEGGWGDEVDEFELPPNLTAEELQGLLAAYVKLMNDWMAFTQEKWRAINDSQLGWKPLRGRWNGWREVYSDSWDLSAVAAQSATEAMDRRFDLSESRGSAAGAVAAFLHDLESLQKSLVLLETAEPGEIQSIRVSRIIRNPMIVDIDSAPVRPSRSRLRLPFLTTECDRCGVERPRTGPCPECGAPPPIQKK